MLSVAGLSMNFGQKVLFENVSLKFTPGNCYGIIGANGTGKSTFIKILTKEVEQVLGEVIVEPGKRMGWLRQDISGYDDQTVISVALRGHLEVHAIQSELDKLYAKAEMDDKDMARMSELQERFEAIDGYSQESAAAEVLTDLGVEPALHQKLLGDIDTAKKVRVFLAQALFSKPDILLLDEPTNNLDIPAMVWLEQYLADYEGVIVVVSHDRHFLNRVCTHTLRRRLQDHPHRSPGRYDVYQAQEQLARAHRSKESGRVERQVLKLKRFVERFKSNAARSKQATSREKLIDQLSGQKVLPSSRVAPRLHLQVPQAQRPGRGQAGEADLRPSRREPKICDKFEARIDRNDRIAIVGRNGIGKSSPDVPADPRRADAHHRSKGTVTWSNTTTRAYFPQEGGDLFKNKKPEHLRLDPPVHREPGHQQHARDARAHALLRR